MRNISVRFVDKVERRKSYGKIRYSQIGHRWQYGTCALHAGHLRFRICNLYCFPTETVAAWTRLNVTMYVQYMACTVHGLYSTWLVQYTACLVFSDYIKIVWMSSRLANTMMHIVRSTDWSIKLWNIDLYLIFVVPSIMLYSGEISPTRCNNCVFILRNGFTLHVSGDNLTHHQEYNAVYGHRWAGSLRLLLNLSVVK